MPLEEELDGLSFVVEVFIRCNGLSSVVISRYIKSRGGDRKLTVWIDKNRIPHPVATVPEYLVGWQPENGFLDVENKIILIRVYSKMDLRPVRIFPLCLIRLTD